MNNTQLSLLLYQYYARLLDLVDAAELELPDDVKSDFSIFTMTGRETRRKCLSLDPLRLFAAELKRDSEVLLTSHEEMSVSKK